MQDDLDTMILNAAISHADAFSVLAEIPDGAVDLGFTDPPWQTPDRKSTITRRTASDIRVDYREFTADFDWPRFVTEAARVLRPDGYWLVWCGWHNISHILDLANVAFGFGSNQAISRFTCNPPGRARGKKDGAATDPKTGNPVKIGGGLISAFDMIAVLRRPGATPSRCNYGIDATSNSEAYAGQLNVRFCPNPRGMPHPASKPIALVRSLVREHSVPGDVVLDPCCGGGSILAGAVAEGRYVIGCDSGVDDTREGATGRPWADIARDLVRETIGATT